MFNLISHSFAALTHEISSWPLEDKIQIHARACNILYKSNNLPTLNFRRWKYANPKTHHFLVTCDVMSTWQHDKYLGCVTVLSVTSPFKIPATSIKKTLHESKGKSCTSFECQVKKTYLQNQAWIWLATWLGRWCEPLSSLRGLWGQHQEKFLEWGKQKGWRKQLYHSIVLKGLASFSGSKIWGQTKD